MDAEKQSLDSAEVYKHQGAHASTGPLAVKYLRAAQHVFAVIGISFIARAIERNRQVPGITSEEKALLASVSLLRSIHPTQTLTARFFSPFSLF
jgi:hypothetical protein